MTDRHDTGKVSSYLQYLPAPLQDGRFIGRFLLAFEAILTGAVVTGDADHSEKSGPMRLPGRGTAERLQGLGETLDRITAYFQPQQTPADFLPWLARWVAVDLREDWSVDTQRKVVAHIVPLYMLRGTRRGIEQAVRLCVSEAMHVRVHDRDSATRPYYFEVALTIDTKQDPSTLQQLFRKVEAAIELQKPAHTYYSWQLRYPSLELLDQPVLSNPTKQEMKLATEGIYVAMNTVLGSAPADMGTGNKLPVPRP